MAGPFTLQIIHASDLEAANTALSRMPQFAAIVDKLDDQYANTLKLISGDGWLPGPFYAAEGDPSETPALRAALTYAGVPGGATANAASTRVSVAFMDVIGTQVASFGNHEFDGGTGPVNDALGVANFPYLSANYDFSKDPNLRGRVTAEGQEASSIKGKIAGSAVVTINGEKIGIVSDTTQVLQSITSLGLVNSKTGNIDDMPALAKLLQPYIDALTAQGINKIVLSSHLQEYQLEQQLIPLLKGVDIVVSAGSHALFEPPGATIRPGDVVQQPYPVILTGGDGNPVLQVNTQNEYSYVGRIVAQFDANGVIVPASVDPAVSRNFVTTDEQVAALYGSADPYAAGGYGAAVKALVAPLSTVISVKDGNLQGYSAVFLDGNRVTVRQQESNLGDLTADANLFVARQVDPATAVSIKNGGGIRDVIGSFTTGLNPRPIPTVANPLANKPANGVSQLDIENTLRFNNNLSLVTITAAQLKQEMEFGASLVDPAATPGGFVQVGGLRVSYDLTRPAQVVDIRGNPTTTGQRVRNLAITNDDGSIRDVIVADGVVVGDASRPIRMVTLDFISTSTQGVGTVGGDLNPLASYATNVVALTNNPALGTGLSTFAAPGTEQDALGEYLKARYSVAGDPYIAVETPQSRDQRIQVLSVKADEVLSPGTAAAADLVAGASTLGGRFIGAALGGTGFVIAGTAGAMAPPLAGRSNVARFGGGTALLPTGYKAAALTGSGTLFGQGSDYLLTATQAGGTLVAQGSGGATLVAAQAGSVLFGGAGSTTLVGGDGDDTLVGGAGAQTIYTGAGRNLVGLGGGSSVVLAQGQDTIIADGGTALVQTAGAATVFGGSGALTFLGGAGQSVVVAGSGSATVFGGTGGGLLAGGRAGGNVLIAGQGATTLFGGGSGDTLYAVGPTADTLIAAATGNATLVGAGSTGANAYYAGGGANLIGGGSGSETFFAGRGQATMIGGAGGDTFSFNNGLAGGAVTITDFNQAEGDRLAVVGYAGGAAAALATAQSAGGSTTLSLTDGTRITLQGVTGLTGSAFA